MVGHRRLSDKLSGSSRRRSHVAQLCSLGGGASIMTYRNLIILGFALFILCSCKKSKEAQYDLWADKASEMAQYAVTNWSATNVVDSKTSNALSGLLGAVASVKSDVAKELMIRNAEAAQFLLQLRERNRLPGVSKDEHGQIYSEDFDLMVSNKIVVVEYPMERIFHLVKDGSTSTNNYVVLKESKDAEWKLQKAWEIDSNGQILQEWQIK